LEWIDYDQQKLKESGEKKPAEKVEAAQKKG
jgi:hypothetical protein